MTSFGDMVFSMGVPLVGSGIPSTFGTTYFVDADGGSDGNSGLKMTEAKATVLAAYNLTTSGKHDVIVMTGNAAHAIATTLAVSKNRVHFVGLGGGSRYLGQRTRWEMGVTTGSEISLLTVTGVGCTFTNIKMRSTDSNTSSIYCVVDAGEYTQFTNCGIEHGGLLTTATVADLACNSDGGFYKNCSFGALSYQVNAARQNVLFTTAIVTGKQCRDPIFEDCLFLVDSAGTTFVSCRATTADIERMCLMRKCIFWSSKVSGTVALVWGISSALTVGQVLLDRCTVQNITNVCATGLGVFTNSPTPVAAATESVTVHTS